MKHLALKWMIKSFFVGYSPSGIKTIKEELKNFKKKREVSSKTPRYSPIKTSYKNHPFFGKLIVMSKNDEIAFGVLTFNGEVLLCSKNFSFSNAEECQFFTIDFCELFDINIRSILGVYVNLKTLELKIQTKNKSLLKELCFKLAKQNFSKEFEGFLSFVQEKNKQVFSLNFEKEDIENMGWIGRERIFLQKDENNCLQFKEGEPHDVELINQTESIVPKNFRGFSVRKSIIKNLQNTNSNSFDCFVLQHPEEDQQELGIARFESEYAKSFTFAYFS